MKINLIACFAAVAGALLACGILMPAAAFDLPRPTISAPRFNAPRLATPTVKPGVVNSAGGTNVGVPALDAASKDAAKMTVPLGGGGKGTTVIKHGDSGARCRGC